MSRVVNAKDLLSNANLYRPRKCKWTSRLARGTREMGTQSTSSASLPVTAIVLIFILFHLLPVDSKLPLIRSTLAVGEEVIRISETKVALKDKNT